MATLAPSVLVSGLGRALVQKGVLKQTDAEHIQTAANSASQTFVEQLVASKKMTPNEVAEFAANSFGLPMLDIAAFDLTQIQPEWIDLKLIVTRRAIPLVRRGNRLFVAMSDPTHLQALEEFRFKTNLVAEPLVVEDDKLAIVIAKIAESSDKSLSSLVSDDDIDLNMTGGESASVEDTSDVDDAPVVKYIQKILLDAINTGVSDIHFEPYEKFYRIRYRLDGQLLDVAQPPLALKDKISTRIKVVSRLDIAEKRVPQDGRLKLELSKTKSIDFRVSTLPTLYGEKIVMRILDSSSAMVGIDALGYDPDQKAILMEAIARPYGMILVTGPTGSGKTVSLYSCLNLLNKPGINICTAEDPAEINLPGINQVNVNDKAGLTFATALRSFLRQDPDIVMVGEIRDLETGEIAVKAAQTGHLVLSTLHTNDAPSTITRLMNMGIAPFNIASSVHLITAQRLCRKLCLKCKEPEQIPIEAMLRAGFREDECDGSWVAYKAVGCDACKTTGFKGRVGIYQVMPISAEMEKVILRNGTAPEIEELAASEGVRSLRQAGLGKVKKGMTSLTEIEAVTNI